MILSVAIDAVFEKIPMIAFMFVMKKFRYLKAKRIPKSRSTTARSHREQAVPVFFRNAFFSSFVSSGCYLRCSACFARREVKRRVTKYAEPVTMTMNIRYRMSEQA